MTESSIESLNLTVDVALDVGECMSGSLYILIADSLFIQYILGSMWCQKVISSEI